MRLRARTWSLRDPGGSHLFSAPPEEPRAGHTHCLRGRCDL